MAQAKHAKGSFFTRFSAVVARVVGRPGATLLAALIVLVWALSGPFVGYSENWQLVINTGTTIITFLMVFVIQASQNRDTAAVHLKLDELIRATKHAQNVLLDIDSLDESTLEKLRKKYEALAHEASDRGERADADDDTPMDAAKRNDASEDDAPEAVRKQVESDNS